MLYYSCQFSVRTTAQAGNPSEGGSCGVGSSSLRIEWGHRFQKRKVFFESAKRASIILTLWEAQICPLIYSTISFTLSIPKWVRIVSEEAREAYTDQRYTTRRRRDISEMPL